MQIIGANADPNSIGATAQAAQVLQAQAIADSQFDPAVPARPSQKTASGFTNPALSLADILLILLLIIIIILITLIVIPRSRLIIRAFLKPLIRLRQ
jgi:hypothetical protein